MHTLVKWICKLISTNFNYCQPKKHSVISSKTKFPAVSKFVHAIFVTFLTASLITFKTYQNFH